MISKKEQEREELHKTIWKIANDLRGSVDGWDFKQYVLGLLFYRFISENIENYVNENQRKAGEVGFEYRNLSDDEAINGKSQILEEKGFFILPSELFCNIRKTAKNNENLNVVIANIFDNIESSARGTASEDDVKGLFDDFDVKGNKLGNTVEERNEKLAKMLEAIGDLKLGDYRDNTIDTFGDAYEFLMTMYASNAGKSGGEFFTPQEVGELLARIVIMDKKEVNKVYDPACGSGGLLLKFAKILGKDNVKQGFYGQEKNLTTYNLARINMFLHDINYNNFNIAREDTLIHPMHWDDEPFDAIVSNPPYSIKWAGKSNPILINDERFAPAGILAPESKADLAFTMHMLSWLSQRGTAAIVEYPGVFTRANEKGEPGIRKYLIENNYIEAIIKMPRDLFFGTTIDVCILVLKKNKTDNNILFLDASDEFIRVSNKNKLSEENISNIIDLLKNRKNVENKCILVSNDDIDKKKYNLSVTKYLKNTSDEEEIDIDETEEKISVSCSSQTSVREKLNKKIEQIKNIDFDSNLSESTVKKIGEICSLTRGKVMSKQYLAEHKGDYPVYSSQTANNGVFGNIDTYAYDGEYVQWTTDGAHAGSIFLRNGKFSITNVCGILKVNEEYKDVILPSYLAYFLTIEAPKHVDYSISNPKLMSNVMSEIEIIIPPLKIQREIVSLLQEVDDLQKELLDSLAIEIKQRNNQLDYYKNVILYGFDN